MKYLTAILLLVISCSMEGQNLPATSIINESGFIASKTIDKNTIGGSLFLNDEWTSDAVVYTIDDNMYKPRSINFNVQLSTFIVKIAEDSLFTLDKTRVKSIQFNSQLFELLNDKYYETLSKGKLNVYKDYYVSIKKGAIDPISKSKVTEDKYVIKSKYFLKEDDKLQEIRISKKSILKLCAKEKVSAVKNFINENKLSVKEDKDLSKILTYYNSL